MPLAIKSSSKEEGVTIYPSTPKEGLEADEVAAAGSSLQEVNENSIPTATKTRGLMFIIFIFDLAKIPINTN